MRWDGPAGGVALLDRHLARLAASAALLAFPLDEAAVRAALAEATAGRAEGPRRLRLLLDAEGRSRIEVAPIGASMRRAVLYPEPAVPDGPFWRHKTTHRPHYEAPYQWARAAGFDEAILLDADGRVIEGTRTTVWVERGGRLLTPPLTVGGLPGVHRAHLLATRPDAGEAVLARADLFIADAVYLANAVHGLQRVSVHPAPAPSL